MDRQAASRDADADADAVDRAVPAMVAAHAELFESVIGNRAMGRLARSLAAGAAPGDVRRLIGRSGAGAAGRRLARSPTDRGGAGAGGPTFEIENGQVRLYRAMDVGEADSLHRFGDFNLAPSGGGKYFAFTEADARAFAKAQYGSDAQVTLVVTTVPKGFIPSSPGTRTTQSRPYIDRNGQASMQTGEVYMFYDPRGGGWSLHVDDEALPILNDSMTTPRILQSPAAKVGGGGGAGSGGGGGGGGGGGSTGRPKTTATVGDPPGPIGVDPGVQGFQGRSAQANAMAAAVVGALNNISNWVTEYVANQEWQKTKPLVVKTLSEEPWLGVLIVYRYSQGPAPITMQAPKVFQGIDTFYAESQGAAQAQERQQGFLIDAGPEGRVITETRWVAPAAPGTKPKPPPRAAPAPDTGPKSASDLDKAIDAALARKAWSEVALILNGFSVEDIKTRVASDPRLTGHRRELMKGALAAMILWPYRKDGVTDAISATEPGAARQGRIDYLDDVLDTGRGGEPARNFGSEKWKRAALTLNGFGDADLAGYVPRDLDKCKLIREESIKAGLDRVKKAIEDSRPGQDWSIV